MTASFSLSAAILFCFPTLQVVGQDETSEISSPLQYAQNIAAITGRPIFAVAGQST
jgi:hypothetical protein